MDVDFDRPIRIFDQGVSVYLSFLSLQAESMPHWTSIPIGRDGRDSLFDRSMDVDFDRPIRIFDQNFGLGLREEDIVPSSYSPYYSRGRRLYSRQQSGASLCLLSYSC